MEGIRRDRSASSTAIPCSAAGVYFGWSLALDGGTIAVGANGDDDQADRAGSAYLFHVSDWMPIPESAPGGANATKLYKIKNF